MISIGDVLLAIGIFWAIVYSMTRAEAPSRSALALGASDDAAPGDRHAAAPPAPPTPMRSVIPAEVSEAGAEMAGMRRQSPYLRLFGNRNF